MRSTCWSSEAQALAGARQVQVGSRQWLVAEDAFAWLEGLPEHSIHAVVTDPPYGAREYDGADLSKLRRGKGGLWRIPPTLDGVQRRPVPRFTVLTDKDRDVLRARFQRFGAAVARALVPGGHLILASQPLLSSLVFEALVAGGLEKRGEIIRVVKTLRGGDRPKGAHEEFAEVTVMPRSCWEPWGLFRAPLDGTVAQTLRVHGTGGLRRLSEERPFPDLLHSAPARGKERSLSQHPSLKPQAWMRAMVRAVLPLGEGIVVDPFAGSGSTLAAAAALDIVAIGVERDPGYFVAAQQSIPTLAALSVLPTDQ